MILIHSRNFFVLVQRSFSNGQGYATDQRCTRSFAFNRSFDRYLRLCAKLINSKNQVPFLFMIRGRFARNDCSLLVCSFGRLFIDYFWFRLRPASSEVAAWHGRGKRVATIFCSIRSAEVETVWCHLISEFL